jgi:hypothetical protein
MNDNIKIGADLHAGDGGYSIGTQEKYDEFAKGRNQSLGNMRIKQLKEQAMEWVPNMADPDTKIRLLNAEKFAELIVRECAQAMMDYGKTYAHPSAGEYQSNEFSKVIKEHFGVEE